MQGISLHIRWMLYGIVMGAAQIIPGISAGSVALLLCIYPQLMHIASNARAILRAPFDDLKRLSALLTGFCISLVIASHPISWLLTHHTSWSYAAFIGFIIGSLPSCREAMEPKTLTRHHYTIMVATCILATSAFLCLPNEPSATVTPSLWTLAAASIFAGSTMILPGISGSWLLLIMGCYPTWINSIKNFDLIPLSIMGSAALIGAALTLYLLANMFKHHAKSVLAGLFGLMIASLVTLCPYLSLSNEHDATLMAWMVGAAFISYMLTHMSRRKKVI